MRVLALESAVAACSAAVWRDGHVAGRRFAAMARGQAEALVPFALAALDESGLGFADLDLIAVTVGPGSFTGLRTGLAAARGFALARTLPVAGFTTLEVVAAAVPHAVDRPLLIALESGTAMLYVQLFPHGGEPEAATPEATAALAARVGAVVAGSGAARVLAALPAGGAGVTHAPGAGLPDAADLAGLAARRWAEAGPGGVRAPQPLYLGSPRTTLGAASRGLRA